MMIPNNNSGSNNSIADVFIDHLFGKLSSTDVNNKSIHISP